MELKELKITRLYAVVDTFVHSDEINTINVLSMCLHPVSVLLMQ